jgi:hypothetical protein
MCFDEGMCEDYSESNFWRAVNKASDEKKSIHKIYVLNLSHFSMQSQPEMKHFLYGGISFCIFVSKKSAACELSHVLYCNIRTYVLKRLLRAIQKNGRGMLTSGVVLLHDNALLHTAARTRALLEHFNWELRDHPPYNRDHTPSDYHPFTYLKNCCDQSVSIRMRNWWKASYCFDTGIHTHLLMELSPS